MFGRPALGLALLGILTVVSIGRSSEAQTEDECITANDRAVALRKTGKLIEARKELTACAQPACPDVIRASCIQRVAELSSAIPGIRLEVKDAGGNDVSDVLVRIDGVVYSERIEGAVISLDPGAHEFVLERRGKPPVTRRFVLQEGEPARRETVVLADPAAVPAPEVPAAPGRPAEVPIGEAPPPRGQATRTWGLSLGIAGAAGMAGAVILGFVAKGIYQSASHPQGSDVECSVGGACTADGAHREQTAHDWANVATAVFVGGAILGAAGIALFAVGATSGQATRDAALVLTPGGAIVEGTW